MKIAIPNTIFFYTLCKKRNPTKAASHFHFFTHKKGELVEGKKGEID